MVQCPIRQGTLHIAADHQTPEEAWDMLSQRDSRGINSTSSFILYLQTPERWENKFPLLEVSFCAEKYVTAFGKQTHYSSGNNFLSSVRW